MRCDRLGFAGAGRWVALLTVALVAACGGSQGTGATPGSGTTSPAATGRLHIVATRSPTCPVQHAGGPPCVAPYTGPLEVIRPNGSVLAVSTSAGGTADLNLPPGVYQIGMAHPYGAVGGLHQPVSVTVRAGSSTTAAVDIDTGIR